MPTTSATWVADIGSCSCLQQVAASAVTARCAPDAGSCSSVIGPARVNVELKVRFVNTGGRHLPVVSSVDARDRHRRARRPRQVVARAAAHGHRPRPLRGGEAARADDRPRLRPLPSSTARRSASSTSRATSGSCATCSPASAASTPACSSSPPPRGGSRRARSTCASSSCVGVTHGVVALTKVDLLDDAELVELATLEVADRLAGTFLAGAPIVPVAAPSGVGVDELAAALAALARDDPGRRRSRPAAAVDRPRVRGQGQRHGRHRHADRRLDRDRRPRHRRARRPAGPGARRSRRSGAVVDAHRAGQPRRAQPRRASSTRALDARRRRRRRPAGGGRRTRFDASLDRARHARPRGVAARRLPRLHRVGRARRAPARARSGVDRARRDGRRAAAPAGRPCRCCRATATCCARRGRDETVGGGEVLDVAPVLPASRARPDRRVERVVAERGWVDADELELLTGERPRADGRSVGGRPGGRVAAAAADARATAVGRAASSSPRSTSASGRVLDTLDDVVVDGTQRPAPRRGRPARRPPGHRRPGRRRAGAAGDPTASTAPSCASSPAAACWSSATACGSTPTPSPRRRRSPPACWRADAGGFTVSEFREAAGITRKHAVPLLSRARRPRHHPPPRRPCASPARASPAILRSPRSRRAELRRLRSDQADSRSRRRSSWVRPPQMP